VSPIWYFAFGVICFIVRGALKLPASGVQANIKITQKTALLLMAVFFLLGILFLAIGLFVLFEA